MSLNPRDLTQGGQVAFMRLKMFLQINNLISYYVIMGIVLFGIAVLLMRISIQNLTNGIIYWFVRVMCKRKLTAVCSHQTRIGNLDAHLI